MSTVSDSVLAEELVTVNAVLNKCIGKRSASEYMETALSVPVSAEALNVVGEIVEKVQAEQALGDRESFRVDGIVARLQVQALRLDKTVQPRW